MVRSRRRPHRCRSAWLRTARIGSDGGDHPLGNAVIGDMIAVPVGGLLALAWAWCSHTPLREIGYSKPESWLATLTVGLLVGIGLKLLMKSIVMPLLGADPINQAYHFLAGNTPLLPAAVWTMLVAGFGEETLFSWIPVRAPRQAVRDACGRAHLDRAGVVGTLWPGSLLRPGTQRCSAGPHDCRPGVRKPTLCNDRTDLDGHVRARGVRPDGARIDLLEP